MRRTYSYFCGEDIEASSTSDEIWTRERQDNVDTGLVTKDGKTIYRANEAIPFGFVSSHK